MNDGRQNNKNTSPWNAVQCDILENNQRFELTLKTVSTKQ